MPRRAARPLTLVASWVLATSVWAVFGVTVAGCQEEAMPEPVAFELLSRGGLGVAQPARPDPQAVAYRLIHDAATWREFWTQSSADSLPGVDFETEAVLCVYQGKKATGGYEISVHDLRLTGETLRVTLELREPNPGDMLIQVETDPYAIYKVQLPQAAREIDTATLDVEFQRHGAESDAPIAVQKLGAP